MLNQQLREWDLLFPAEQRPIRATLDHLAALPDPALEELLAPIKTLRRR